MIAVRELLLSRRRRDRGVTFAGPEGTSSLSYDEIVGRGIDFAREIGRRAGRDRFIGLIWVNPSIECLIAMTAVVLAGGIPVPLHGYAAAGDLRRTVGRLEPDVAILSPDKLDLWRRLQAGGHRLAGRLFDGASGREIDAGDGGAVRERRYVPPDETCMVFLSSGSTGEPKGIMLSDRNIASNLDAILDYTSLSDEDRVLITKSPGYCSTVTGEWLAAQAAGADATLTGGLVHPLELARLVRDHAPTFLSTVPPVLQALADSAKWSPEEWASLRMLQVAGGPVPHGTLVRMADRLPRAELIFGYGLTEASPRVAYLPYGQLRNKPGSVGIPLQGVSVSIVRDGAEAARGQPGEVVVQGPNVMLGYYGDPERTAEVLDSRGLRTRDIGRMDADGYLYITGRADNAVHVGGHTIYPEAVELALSECPGIGEAAVVAVEDDRWGSRLVAVIAGEGSASERELHAWCGRQLQPAMRPREFRFVARLPRTPTGKLDRVALKSLAKENRHVHGR